MRCLLADVDAIIVLSLINVRMKKIAISSKNFLETLAESKNSRTFATAIEKQRLQAINEKLVPWMSGLVSGLQNRVRRFESARNLKGRKFG